MRLPKPLRRRKSSEPPRLRRPGERTKPDPDGEIKLWRGGSKGDGSNGDNRSAALRYGPGG